MQKEREKPAEGKKHPPAHEQGKALSKTETTRALRFIATPLCHLLFTRLKKNSFVVVVWLLLFLFGCCFWLVGWLIGWLVGWLVG